MVKRVAVAVHGRASRNRGSFQFSAPVYRTTLLYTKKEQVYTNNEQALNCAMTISLNRLLLHMAWANQKTFTYLQSLPEASLKAFATNPEWPGAEIAHHIVDSADHYVFQISDTPALTRPEDPCIDDIEQISDLARIKDQAAIVDKALLECVKLDDLKLELKNGEGKIVTRWRSTILSQAIHHATEHRAQIASALEAKGFAPVDLDELDLWSYEIASEN